MFRIASGANLTLSTHQPLLSESRNLGVEPVVASGREPNKSVTLLVTFMTHSHAHRALLMSFPCAPKISQCIAVTCLLCCL